MKNIIFFIFLLFIFNSCSDELITIVDEYNPPYDIKAIPGDGTISISFWSGVLADDFVGFNLYIRGSSEATFSNAVYGSGGSFPTVRVDTHTRTNFTLPITSGTYNNNDLYYVTVTAYGTNDLAEGSRIETKINTIVPVIPRAEGDETGTTPITVGNNTTGTANVATVNNNLLTPATADGWGVQYFGVQSNFNSITLITNNNFLTSGVPYSVGGLYIFSNGNNGWAKVWVTSSSGYHWAYRNQGTYPAGHLNGI